MDEILSEIYRMKFITTDDLQYYEEEDKILNLDSENSDDVEDWYKFKQYMENENRLKDYNKISNLHEKAQKDLTRIYSSSFSYPVKALILNI